MALMAEHAVASHLLTTGPPTTSSSWAWWTLKAAWPSALSQRVARALNTTATAGVKCGRDQTALELLPASVDTNVGVMLR